MTIPQPPPPPISPFEDYAVGQLLTLNLPRTANAAVSTAVSTVVVRIREMLTRTCSCAMVVEIVDNRTGLFSADVAFLKLLDRRFADGFRENLGIDPWEDDDEQHLIDAVRSGAIHKFLHKLRHEKDFVKDTEESWTVPEEDAYMVHEIDRLYEKEAAVYEALREHQGRHIPKLFSTVHIDVDTGIESLAVLEGDHDGDHDGDQEGNWAAFFQIKGFLLEYIPGCSLKGIPECFPRSSWQGIVDQAISIVSICDEHDILNTDVTPRNFVVCDRRGDSDQGEGGPQVFMIDFGCCRFRGAEESDAEWGLEKDRRDEQGAVGVNMKRVLGEHDFELRYKPSQKYWQWADAEPGFMERAIKVEKSPGVFSYYWPPSGGS